MLLKSILVTFFTILATATAAPWNQFQSGYPGGFGGLIPCATAGTDSTACVDLN
jgi:hypothetical protein